MSNSFTAPTWVKAEPHASSEYQVGDSDPAGATDVINRAEKGIYAAARRIVNSLFDGVTLDFTDQSTVSSFGSAVLVASGGTGLTSYAVGDLLYASGATTLAKLADVAVGAYLRSGGVTTAPLWSTLVLPNAATANRIAYATSTNTWGESADLTFDGTTFKTLAAHFLGSAGSPAGQVYIKSAAAGTLGLVVDNASLSSVNTQEWWNVGSTAAYIAVQGTVSLFFLVDRNLGDNTAGTAIFAGRNASAGTHGGAPGVVAMRDSTGTVSGIWPDDSGNLRVLTGAGLSNAQPTGNANTPTIDANTAGVIVGTQTSLRSAKHVLARAADPAEALSRMLALHPAWFTYKNGAYGGTTFLGPIIEDGDEPWYGMDHGKVFNPVSFAGHTTLAIQALHGQHKALDDDVQALKRRIKELDDEVAALKGR